MSEWAAFWLMCAVFIVCECIIYLNGSDTLMWGYKTPIEKQLQQKILESKK